MLTEILSEMDVAIAGYPVNPRPADLPRRLRTLDALLACDWLDPSGREAVAERRAKVEALRRGAEWRPGITLPPG